MAKQNIDFEVACTLAPPDEGQAAASIKAGSLVCIRYAAAPRSTETAAQEPQQEGQEHRTTEQPSSRVCLDTSGQHMLGPVPETARKRLASLGEELQGSVRSVKRDEAGRPTQLLVRVQVENGQPVMQGRLPGESVPSQQRQQPAAAPYEVDTDGFQLRCTQLEQLVQNEELRDTLKDERLQRLLTEIDGSSNREKALDTAMQGPAFQEFADKLLTLMDAAPRRDVEATHAPPPAALSVLAPQ